MAKEGRNILAWVFKKFFDSLKPRQFRGNLIGKDYLGNEYYEIPKSGRRASRWYETKDKIEENFDEPLPVEWESWLRHRRRDPPTEEEIAANLELTKAKKIKAAEIDKKFGTGQTASRPLSFPEQESFQLYPGKKREASEKD